MKRLSSSDSLGGLMSICPNSTVDGDDGNNNPIYTRDFQTMLDGLDEEGCVDESCHKKRRLSVDQVKALEKNFEVENKLEPERKVKLAQELGLQPRQVAVWFQNRRARWKTKQLERDYGLLKANHDALTHKYESLQRENESLHNEIRELKLKLNGSDGKTSVKDEASQYDGKEKCDLEDGAAVELKENEAVAIFGDFKDGSSDSDSSVILNEDNSSSSPMAVAAISGDVNVGVNAKFGYLETSENEVKIEEHNFFGEESCTTLFSDDQPPTLHWYCNDDWN